MGTSFLWPNKLNTIEEYVNLKMHSVILKPLYHRSQESIAIQYKHEATINLLVRKLPSVKWSQTNKCWYVPLTKASYNLLKEKLQQVSQIDDSVLKTYLEKRKQVTATLSSGPDEIISKAIVASPVWKLNKENSIALEKFIEELKLKAYRPSTIRTYRNEFLQLLQLLKKKNVNDLTPDDLRRYMVYAMEKQGIKENTAHSRINAIKFYFEQVLKREKFFWEIPRPKKPSILPKVLGEDELRRLFNAITFKKHKAILFTAYSAGLRVSEVVNLQLKHIDRSRMQMLIQKSKGKKDRYVGLSPILLDILENYYKEIKPKPLSYLFEGQQPGTAYNARSAQKVFQVAKEKAGIKKEIGFHSLRHSFATHLLEKGVDIRYIKDLLGHFNIHTTERYLHVKREKLINIVSPFDDLWKKEDIKW